MLDVSAPRATSVDQRADTNRGCISKSCFFLFFPLPSPFAFLLSTSLGRCSCFLYPFTRYPICCIVGYSCVQREVCVIGKAGKGTFIERPPFLVLHRFTCYVRSWIPGSPSVPLSAPLHRRLLFGSAFVRTSWSSIAVAVAKASCGCHFVSWKRINIVSC